MEICNFLKNHKGISFHMPAHKNRADLIFNDITEIFGADNLREPSGIIKKAQKKASEILGVKDALFLTNGASSGIITALLTLGETKITVDRNCHESVISGLILSGGMPEFVYPKNDEVFDIPSPLSDTDIDIKTDNLIYTATTYFGGVCDSKKIRNKLGKNAIMIADEAHASHFYFSENLKKYRACYSDISILSLHKSLPTLTGGAVLAVNNENLDSDFIFKCKNLITTTSPSYPIMASLEYGINMGEEIYKSNLPDLIEKIKDELQEKTDILIYNSPDPWKLLVNFINCDVSSVFADKILREKYNIYSEGIFGNNILFMISPYNTEEELLILKKSLIQISKEKCDNKDVLSTPVLKTKTDVTPREAYFAKGERVTPKNAIGRISKENITPFPPCVPIITVGEIITEEIAEYLSKINRDITVVK